MKKFQKGSNLIFIIFLFTLILINYFSRMVRDIFFILFKNINNWVKDKKLYIIIILNILN